MKRDTSVWGMAGATCLAALVFAGIGLFAGSHAQAAKKTGLKIKAVQSVDDMQRYLVGDKDEALVEATVQNKSKRKVRSFKAKVFLSVNDTAGAGDEVVGALKVPKLKPNEKTPAYARIDWPTAVDDGRYYFVACLSRKRRCEPTERFTVYVVSDRLSGRASGTRVIQFSGHNFTGDPMQATYSSEWTVSLSLEYAADPSNGDGYTVIASSGTEKTSGESTTQVGGGTERCQWSAERTITGTVEGELLIERYSPEPIHSLGLFDPTDLQYTASCTADGGPAYERSGTQDSAIWGGSPTGEDPFGGFPLSGTYDHVQDDTTYYGDAVRTTYHTEWHLEEVGGP